MASKRPAPMASAHSIAARSALSASRKALTPMVTPLSALPSSMPSSGMVYCGSNHWRGCTMAASM